MRASSAHLQSIAEPHARALPRVSALPTPARAVSRAALAAQPARPSPSQAQPPPSPAHARLAALARDVGLPLVGATRAVASRAAALALAFAALTGARPALADPPAQAAAVEQPAPTSSATTQAGKIASFAASGLIFKDSVEVVALPDPALPGVVIYVTEVKRSLVDKLTSTGGGFFAEPSAASVTCVARGGAPVSLAPGADVGGPEGRDIFSERKSLSLVAAKTLRVRRVVDRANGSVLYVSYSTRLSGAGSGGDPASTDGAGGGTGSARYRTSVCALPLAE